VASIEHLASRLRGRAIPAGATVVEQGEPGQAFFVIADGAAEVLG
jgi:CRP-like cAMP-binding protein